METEQKTVALIDDDPLVRKVIKRFLKGSGFVVHTFGSCEEFLAAVASFAADCLVLDVNLGSCSGFDVARHPLVTALRVPVVMMSGCAEEEHRAQADALGCVAFLSKPLRPPELLDAIARAVGP
jgi:FixJ family two-component response regulator